MQYRSNPDALLKLSKKGKTLITFVKVSPKYDKDDVDKITRLWQSSLWNNHIQAERLEKFDLLHFFNTYI